MHDGSHELSGVAARRMRRGFAPALLVLGMALASPRAVVAQPAEAATDPNRDASARLLFQEGLGLAEKGQWEAAEDRFRRALILRASPVIAYNLASTLVERGKLIEASEILRKVEQDDKTDPTMRHSVETLQADLGKRIGRIRVIVRGKASSDQVSLDGNPLLDAQLDVEIPIDPGAHRLNLTRGTQSLDVRELRIEPGASQQVVLRGPGLFAPSAREVAAAARAAPPMAATTSEPEVDRGATSDSPSITGRWWFWTGIGAVAVAAVVVAVVVAGAPASKPAAAYQGSFTPASLRVPVSP